MNGLDPCSFNSTGYQGKKDEDEITNLPYSKFRATAKVFGMLILVQLKHTN